MLQELIVRSETQALTPVEQATTAASGFARASKSAATGGHIKPTLPTSRLGVSERHSVEPLPATVATIAAYLASLARSGLKASTITRRCAGIRYMHRMAGLEPPTSSEAIKAVLAGIRRSIGTAATRKAPATAETIRAIVAEIPSDLRGLRDRALLLLGFAGALRRSELVALDVADLEETAEGLLVRIRRSKTDQEGVGDFVSILHGSRLRPVAAVKAWLESAGITEGPIFRSIKKGGSVTLERLSDHSVAQIVKNRAEAAGLMRLSFRATACVQASLPQLCTTARTSSG
jgi:site-specific recombinase XerD